MIDMTSTPVSDLDALASALQAAQQRFHAARLVAEGVSVPPAIDPAEYIRPGVPEGARYEALVPCGLSSADLPRWVEAPPAAIDEVIARDEAAELTPAAEVVDTYETVSSPKSRWLFRPRTA